MSVCARSAAETFAPYLRRPAQLQLHQSAPCELICVWPADEGVELWKWDFSEVCSRGQDYGYAVPGRTDNLRYAFQPCGTVANTECTGAVYSTGSIVQTYQAGDGVACQVLGYGAPIYRPWPSVNGYEPAGVNITYRGEPAVLGQ